MRWPATMPGSTSKVRRGTWRMRIWRPTTPRRCGRGLAQRVLSVVGERRRRVGVPPSQPASSNRRWRSERSRVTSTPVNVTSSSRGIRHPLELVGEHLEHHLVDARSRSAAKSALATSRRLQPRGLDVEQLDVGARRPRTARPTRARHEPDVSLLPITATPIAARCHWS